MSKSAPIRAVWFRTRDDLRAGAMPGSFAIYSNPGTKIGIMSFVCPCGCGAISRIAIGEDHKPAAQPSWEWDGSHTEPTLSPSVNQTQCGWHGILRLGYWEAV